jgi:glycerophosphoryl diester phosphodiesterase
VFDGRRPLVFAHRGGAGLRPENTMAAFDHGAACGADGFELDVRLAHDGELVVIHDETLDRTTDAVGPVSAMTSDDLARVDAGARFRVEDGAPFKGQGFGVPRYRDVLRRFPDAAFVVELKGTDPDVGRVAAAVTREEAALPRVCFGGFSDAVVQAARAEAAQAVTSAATDEIRRALYRSWLGLSPKSPAYAGFQVPERYGPTVVVTRRFVRVMRRAGLFVHIWTVNAEADITRLLEWGVHGVITDVPDLAARTVRAWDSHRQAAADRRVADRR